MKNQAFIDINFVNWEKHLKEGVILVDFWAEWCTACIAQDKIYEAIAEEFKGNLRIGKINVSDNRILANKFGVRNIPFLILLKDGKPVMKMPGIQSKAHLINQIKNHIK
ncbi:MAG: thioredoxin [Bacteroidetes bacterium]|nr:MAG: thioredoxin [Bacteroidota bacterium]